MRLNARLDEEDSIKIKFLVKKTRKTLSAVVKEAIHLFYDKQMGLAPVSSQILKKTGFIACANGNQNLSWDYKKIIQSSLEKKHGHR